MKKTTSPIKNKDIFILEHSIDSYLTSFEHMESSVLKRAYALYLRQGIDNLTTFYKRLCYESCVRTMDFEHWSDIQDVLDFSIMSMRIAESGGEALEHIKRDYASFEEIKKTSTLEDLSEQIGFQYDSWEGLWQDIESLATFNYEVAAKTIADATAFHSDFLKSMQSLGWDAGEVVSNMNLLKNLSLIYKRLRCEGSFSQKPAAFSYSVLWSKLEQIDIEEAPCFSTLFNTIEHSIQLFKRSYDKKETLFDKIFKKFDLIDEKISTISIHNDLINKNYAIFDEIKTDIKKVIPKLKADKKKFYVPTFELNWLSLNYLKDTFFLIYSDERLRRDYGFQDAEFSNKEVLDSQEWTTFLKITGRTLLKNALLLCERDEINLEAVLSGGVELMPSVMPLQQVERAIPVVKELKKSIEKVYNHPFFTDETSDFNPELVTSFLEAYSASFLLRWFKKKNPSKHEQLKKELNHNFNGIDVKNKKQLADYAEREIQRLEKIINADIFNIPQNELGESKQVLDSLELHNPDIYLNNFYSELFSKYDNFNKTSEAYESLSILVPELVPVFEENLKKSFETFNFGGYNRYVLTSLLKTKHAIKDIQAVGKKMTFEQRKKDVCSKKVVLYSDNPSVIEWFNTLSGLNDPDEYLFWHELMISFTKNAKLLLDSTTETSKAMARLTL